ncbi:hypothetical protein QFC20_001917 [Naganishia adeliensis]|uniref:Uncharacterized protein n=1 Tax=Naganishia adeliensis TaxID=92952 RepID=A0ACC2WR41_9TREE|nr:hypothetical protein QFC20_001917 [Naganishia adeliensis]
MSSSQTSTTTAANQQSVLRLRLDGSDGYFGDWQDDLIRDGFAIIRGAIPRERADQYASEFHEWIESFEMGYKRGDPSSVHMDKMPLINEKGMAINYAAPHEDFVWQVRSEPGVVSAFEKVYGTKDLIVSFDAINVTFPNRTDIKKPEAWPHQDQNPEKPDFKVLQGLVNLLPNGPNDGGFIVCRGGHRLSEEYHKEFKRRGEKRMPAWTPEWYGFPEEGMEWLKEKGCEWVKLCAEPGDLIVWDSRAPHYNVPPTSDQARMAIYTCFMPVSDATQEDLIKKKDAFERRVGTTHWPNAKHVGTNEAMRNGEHHGPRRDRPYKEPKLTERAFKLTGIPYIKEAGKVSA